MRPGLRILADDLSGALDTLVYLGLPGVPWPALAVWNSPSSEATAFCTDTRDVGADVAQHRVARAASWLVTADVAFKKIDSRLRGPVAAEIAAVAALQPDHDIVLTPALPEQGRVVAGGRVVTSGRDEPVNLHEELTRFGVACAAARPGDAVPRGVSLWDAATDKDLDRIAAEALRAARPVIFCGSAGLAAAVCRARGGTPPASCRIVGPVLMLAGTDHPATRQQIAEVARSPRCRLVSLGRDAVGWEAVADHLALGRSCVVTVDLLPNIDRRAAAAQIESILAALLARIAMPPTLFVTGGTTLMGIAQRMRVEGLRVAGQVASGTPLSTLVGSRFHGLRVVTKSGGFGKPDCLVRLLDDAD